MIQPLKHQSVKESLSKQNACIYIYDVEIIPQIHDRVPLGSEVKCQGVLVSSCTGSSGFFRGSVIYRQDTSEPSLVPVKPRKA